MVAHDQLHNGHLRSLNVSSDLGQVADLIELCFQGALDDDGYDYITYLRRMAQAADAYTWGFSGLQKMYNPLQGFVYIVDDKLIGNLSILPFRKTGELIYLIANVAVHPDFRRRGIARKLTAKALQFAQSHSADKVWLQVRDDNPSAQQLYLSMGFEERVRRSTWTYKPAETIAKQPNLIYPIHSSKKLNWEDQRSLMAEIYPQLIRWNLGFHEERFDPSWAASLERFIKGYVVKNLSIWDATGVIASFSYEKTELYSDNLWVSCTPEFDSVVFAQILYYLQARNYASKPFSINFPAGRSETLLRNLGFGKNHTLIWMEESKPIPTNLNSEDEQGMIE